MNNLQTLIEGTLSFLNTTIIPFLLAIAFVTFLWNALQYFIFQGDNEEGQQKAKSLVTWSIAAFIVIVSLWGIVNLIVKDFGLKNEVICPDYMKQKGTGECVTK